MGRMKAERGRTAKLRKKNGNVDKKKGEGSKKDWD